MTSPQNIEEAFDVIIGFLREVDRASIELEQNLAGVEGLFIHETIISMNTVDLLLTNLIINLANTTTATTERRRLLAVLRERVERRAHEINATEQVEILLRKH